MVDINDDEDVRYDISETFLNQMTDLWDEWNHTPRKQHRSNRNHRRDPASTSHLTPARYVKQGTLHLAINDPDNVNGEPSESVLSDYFVERDEAGAGAPPRP